MPDRIKVNEKSRLIEMLSFDDVSETDIKSSIKHVREVFKKTGISRVLIDATHTETFPDAVSVFEIFSKFPRELQVAVLMNEDQATAEDLRFIETVSQNRGILLKLFLTRDDAEKWLSM